MVLAGIRPLPPHLALMAAPCQLSSKRAAQKGDGRRGHLSARLFGSSTPEPCTMPNVALPLRHGGSAAWEVPNSRAAAPQLRWPAARQVVTGPRKVQPLPFPPPRSEAHTSELQSLMRISYAVFCLKKQQHNATRPKHHLHT